MLDFGIAKLRADLIPGPAKAGHHDQGGPEPTATDGGRLLGTLGYMSPEQGIGQPIDHRTDIFSFGCVLYEAITGKRAFLGSSAFATLKQIVEHEPDLLSTLVPGAPMASNVSSVCAWRRTPRIDTDPCAKSRATFAKSVARWTTRLSSKSHDVEIVVDTSSLPV